MGDMVWAPILTAYLLGCIPSGLIVARLKGVDLRASGSGNIGATNALRVMGKGAGLITLLGDTLKGTAAVYIAYKVGGRDTGLFVIAGAACVLGHDFPVFTGFKGGKGVATSFGVLLAIAPGIAAAGFAVWLLTVLAFRISSVGALVSFSVMPVICMILYSRGSDMFALSLFLTGMIFIKHRSNIARLIRGDEPRIGRSAAKS
jgi:glycerol-3-phosphate acyltransferase PlsY